MSVNCNKMLSLSDEALEAKSTLARSASQTFAAAISDCYKGIELAHNGIDKVAEVYFASADEKLTVAMEALDRVQGLVESALSPEDAVAWTQHLDFARLYEEGVRTGAIPAYDLQWSRFTSMMASGQVLSASNILREDFAVVRQRIRDVIRGVSNDAIHRNMVGVPYSVLNLQSALLDATAFAQMVAFVNALEPFDPQWTAQSSKEPSTEELTV